MNGAYALRRNVVVVASAGTGKTHALVGALLHALLGLSDLGEPVHPARIVATTFSRKAAAEIRERLATTLATLAAGAPTAYDRDLADAASRLGVSFSGAGALARSRKALAHLGRATLSTLHGFAYSIARRAAFERGAPPGFSLLDEAETKAIVRGSAEHAIATFFRDDPTVVRDQVRASRGTSNLEDSVTGWLLSLEDEGVRARDVSVPDRDRIEMERTFDAIVRAAEELLSDPERRAAAAAFLGARATGGEALADALAALFDFRRPKTPSPAVLALLELRESLQGRNHPDRGRAFARFYESRSAIGDVARGFRELLVRAQEELHRRYEQRAAIGFGAVLAAARDALRDSPTLAAELGARYDLFVVDEFQDTSRVQRDLVYLLWDAAPRTRTPGALPRVLRSKGLFVVGDRKQSIYAFRGADVAIFSETCVDLAGDVARRALALDAEGDAERPPATADFFALRTNRRSSAPILRFVNAMSAELLRGESGSPIRYAPDTEDLHPPKGDDSRDGRVVWMRPRVRGKTNKAADAVLVARAIEERAARGVPYKDMAVLAQTNGMIDAVAHQLARRDVPYVVAGRGFYNAQEVLDVLAMLRVIVRRDDRAAWLTVLRGVWTGVSDRTLLALTEPHKGLSLAIEGWTTGSRRALLDEADREPLRHLVDVVRRLRHAAPRLGSGGTLREAVRELRLEEALLLMPRGAQRVANVRKLLALADREVRPEVFLDACRAAADDAREAEAATFSDADDAVRLLTVHASKGLAFPIVILPEIGLSSPGGGGGALALAKDDAGKHVLATRVVDALGDPHSPPSLRALQERAAATHRAERRRLWYVAMTRAEREMVFVGDVKPTPAALAAPSPFPTLERLAGDPSSGLHVVDVDPEHFTPKATRTRETPRIELIPLRLSARSVPIAATTLQDFMHCPRRFQLAHLFDVSELIAPPFSARAQDTGSERAKSEGTFLHRLLEVVDEDAFGAEDPRPALDAALRRGGLDRAAPHADGAIERASRFLRSAYAREVRQAGAKLLREHAFVVPIEGSTLTVVLRGAIDLLVVHPDGAVDVIDYKRARGPAVEPYVPQLAMYAIAAARLSSGSSPPRLRAGIVFLGGASGAEPVFAKLPRLARLAKDIEASAMALHRARETGRFPRINEARCEELRCGYRALCHPPNARGQLGLFAR